MGWMWGLVRWLLVELARPASGQSLGVTEPRIEVDEAALATLCPHLRPILEAEIRSGNQIVVARSHKSKTYVRLQLLFAEAYRRPTPVEFRGWDYKLAMEDHYYCVEHCHAIWAARPELEDVQRAKNTKLDAKTPVLR